MTSQQITSPAFRYHGGKFRLSPWIISFFPNHRLYVEPFGGAAGVLINKPRSYSEVYNDLDGDLVNFFRVVRDRETRALLIEACVLTPYAREEFELAWKPAEDPVERARRLVVRAQIGFGSAGATKGTTGFRIDAKREYETAQHTWAKYPDTLQALGSRLTGVMIENKPAIEIIGNHDTPETLFYVDPPYVHETRVRITGEGSARGYRFEMHDDDHRDLLAKLAGVEGMVVLSGYHHPIYEEALIGWEKHEKEARISAGRGTAIRTECVWLNPACSEALNSRQMAIDFSHGHQANTAARETPHRPLPLP